MSYDNFRTFFDKNIKQYHPYSDNIFYSSFMSFLLDKFLKDSLSQIPMQFINLFENQLIKSDIYDELLISLGYPEDIVSSLSVFYKKILLKKFSNYHKYKASISHFKEICEIFSEPVNLYELYITKKNDEYYFTPKNIYISNSDLIVEDIKYDDIYNSVSNYFISKDVINNYYENKSILFPIKSNLLFFKLSETLDFSDVENLIISVVLYHFKDSNIIISAYDESFSITLNGISQLWNYLLNLYASKTPPTLITSTITYFDIGNTNNIYSLSNESEFEVLIDEYNNIQNISDVYEFYNNYIIPNFSSFPAMQTTSIEEFKTLLLYFINYSLFEKIEEILSSSSNIEQEIFSLLSGILDSIRTWINNSNDDLLKKYGKYIVKFFHLPFSSIDNSVIYKLIDFFKPYHTDIYVDKSYNIIYKSNTDNIILKDNYRMVTSDFQYSAHTFGDSFILKLDGEIVQL